MDASLGRDARLIRLAVAELQQFQNVCIFRATGLWSSGPQMPIVHRRLFSGSRAIGLMGFRPFLCHFSNYWGFGIMGRQTNSIAAPHASHCILQYKYIYVDGDIFPLLQKGVDTVCVGSCFFREATCICYVNLMKSSVLVEDVHRISTKKHWCMCLWRIDTK